MLAKEAGLVPVSQEPQH